MTFAEFDRYKEGVLQEVSKMIDVKGREYANSEEDRFGNFNRLSRRLGISNAAVGIVYLAKHMDSIDSFISNGRSYSTETIDSRIVDAIAYLLLIGGMLQDQDRIDKARKNDPLKELRNAGRIPKN